jgi:hypothetical protein
MPKEGKKKKVHKKKKEESPASPRQDEHVDGEEFKCTLPGILSLSNDIQLDNSTHRQ